MSSTARNNILRKIRAALTSSTRLPFPDSEAPAPVFQPLQQDIVVEFAEQFTQLQGKFIFCTGEEEARHQIEILCLQHQWTKIYCLLPKWNVQLSPEMQTGDIITCDASITECEALVARTGTMVLSANNSGRVASVYAPVHICIAYTSQLVYDLKDALTHLQDKYGSNLPSLISFATGPSRTADIEKTLVVGVHGPKEVYCFLIDDAGVV
jgi:L-lactate dehydrogenase complex protein LldG